MKKKISVDEIDQSILKSKQAVLNKIIAVVVIFGMLTAIISLWRDIIFGYNLVNSFFNFILVGIFSYTWLRRSSISIKNKLILLIFTSIFISIKSFALLGLFSGSFLFMSHCCLLIALSTKIKQSIVAIFLLSLIIPVAAYFSITDQLYAQVDLITILNSPIVWLNHYIVFLLTSFIIIMGVGQLKEDLQANFSLLRSTINSLKNTNERLTTEIELKAAYEQELILSSRKFKSLFDSSRDGVLLLNSRGQVIEANQIILDMTGYDLEELRHIDIYDFVDDRFREQMKKNFDLVVYGNIQPPLTEFTIYNNKGETIPVELNTNLIITENDVMVLSTIRDISFRKELENEKFNAVIEAEERERERFSKDLHDDLGPVFSAAKLYLQTLQQQETDSKKLQVLEKITTVIDTAVKSVREISHNLSPYLLRDVGLVEAIKTHLRKIEENSELKVSAEVKTEVDRLPVNIEVVIYRVFLELLNNTFKHSSASSIQIFLYYSKSNVKFIYIDNGIGFDLVEKLKKNEGIGLRNMMNRIKAFNGTIKFNSIEGEMVTKIDIAL